jgi:hypothetical protein
MTNRYLTKVRDMRTSVLRGIRLSLGRVDRPALCTFSSLFTAILVVLIAIDAQGFDFKRQLFGTPSTLGLNIVSVDPASGAVNVNGGDTRAPTTPFTWDWGDGTTPQPGFFPLQHTYADRTKNYVLTVTAHYPGDATDSAQIGVRFNEPAITAVPLPMENAVTISNGPVNLVSRMPGYSAPPLTHFDQSHFGTIPRNTIEYVLTAAAFIQHDFVNGNVVQLNDGFRQLIRRDPNLTGGGMYSLWFTDPVAFAASGAAMSGSVQFSSFMHEMGHNVTLNSPANYYYGGKIDGNANAIFSESMAQIFQHATAYELINHAEDYGLSADLVLDIQHSAESSMRIVRNLFDQYVAQGAQFRSWNNPGTPSDETVGTFMTIAFKFAEHAENPGLGYRTPVKRMMELLQLFNEDWRARYDQQRNTAAADAFRSTLLVAAMSYGFALDLREEFRNLNFPIDDATFNELLGMLPSATPGDYNRDSTVDAADYVLWRNMMGQSGAGRAADGDNSGAVDGADYAVWRAHFGQTAGGAIAGTAAVPEPSAATSLLIACAIMLCGRIRLALLIHPADMRGAP